ncbi:MAG: hypothetical protein ABI461_20710, partial [Polyangiaceae bacterium]
GDQAAADITVPLLRDAPKVQVASAPTPLASPSPVARSTSSAQRTIGLVAAGIGIGGLAAGGIFGIIAKSQNDAAVNNHCTNDRCDQRGLDLTSDARTSAAISTVAIAGGGVALISGVVLFVTAPKRSSRTAWTVAPTVGPQGASFSLRGDW